MFKFFQRIPPLIKLVLVSLGGAAMYWLWERWHYPVRYHERRVSETEASPHHFRARDFAGKRPLQLAPEGTGSLYHRRYRVDIADPEIDGHAIMQRMKTDPNDFSPQELAVFEKMEGDDHFQVGDAFYIHITGPWDGPVRVIEDDPLHFAFATLEDHLEAGEIHFSMMEHPTRPGALRFQIESWARSRDEQVRFAYDVVGVAKTAQTTMWTFWCNRVADLSGGSIIGEIDVLTEETDYKQPYMPQSTPRWKAYQPHFERFRQAHPNFDLDRRHEYTEQQGWRIDRYRAELPDEAPGDPVAGGSFELAQDIILNYEFPPPDLVQGIFIPDEPLQERVMIVEGKFWFFTFLFGVRISEVIDQVRDDPERGQARVWGYGYYTLEGHFEMGEITFTVWKFLESGAVEFRMNAYSKPDRISNPFYRIGFKLFGRGLQKRFARESLKRMQQFVAERLMDHDESAAAAEKPTVQPVDADSAMVDEADLRG